MASPARLSRNEVHHPIVEGEWAVRLGKDMPARQEPYSEAEAADAIEALMPAIEFADPRLTRAFSVLELLAINAGSFRVVLGPEVSNWREANFNEFEAELYVDGELRATAFHDGQRSNPIWSICHLANALSKRGIGLVKGQIVSTGVILPLFRLEDGKEITFKVPGVGEAHLTVVD